MNLSSLVLSSIALVFVGTSVQDPSRRKPSSSSSTAQSPLTNVTMASHAGILLANGTHIPSIGWGTWKISSEEAAALLPHAIEMGYRHIDGAAIYMNEKALGESLKKVLEANAVKRPELFIVSKLWNTQHRNVEAACRQSLKVILMIFIYSLPFLFENILPYFFLCRTGSWITLMDI
jgi:hypothetical protein